MSVLIISASFRKDSFSLRFAENMFPDAETVYLKNCRILPCLGCGGCDKTGVCVQKDDMAALLDKMDGAETIVLCYPVYFDGLPSQLKALVDRLQQRYTVSYGVGKKIAKTKKLYPVCSCGGETPPQGLSTLKYCADCLGAELQPVSCLCRTDLGFEEAFRHFQK